ncbi:MAG: DUF2158 domain-containing protein [Acidobacteriaceae bacterium]
MEFKPGDVVQLKSGGPPMTVEHIGKQNHSDDIVVWCVWSEKVGARQEVKEYTFDPIVLRQYKSPYASIPTSRG